jgi:hypothetical protein
LATHFWDINLLCDEDQRTELRAAWRAAINSTSKNFLSHDGATIETAALKTIADGEWVEIAIVDSFLMVAARLPWLLTDSEDDWRLIVGPSGPSRLQPLPIIVLPADLYLGLQERRNLAPRPMLIHERIRRIIEQIPSYQTFRTKDIITPILLNHHWLYAVISGKRRSIYIIDNFAPHLTTTFAEDFQLLGDFYNELIERHYRHQGGQTVHNWTTVTYGQLRAQNPHQDYPIQHDGLSCGVFVCLGALYFMLRNTSLETGDPLSQLTFANTNIFCQNDIPGMREYIWRLFHLQQHIITAAAALEGPEGDYRNLLGDLAPRNTVEAYAEAAAQTAYEVAAASRPQQPPDTRTTDDDEDPESKRQRLNSEYADLSFRDLEQLINDNNMTTTRSNLERTQEGAENQHNNDHSGALPQIEIPDGQEEQIGDSTNSREPEDARISRHAYRQRHSHLRQSKRRSLNAGH